MGPDERRLEPDERRRHRLDKQDETVDAVEDKAMKGKSKKEKKMSKHTADIVSALESSAVLATLANRVETNERNIKGVQSELERLTANVNSQFNDIKKMFSIIQENTQSPQQRTGEGLAELNFQ